MKKHNKILIISLIFNIIILFGAMLFAYKKGGISYINSKVSSVLGKKDTSKYGQYYFDKVNSFKNIEDKKQIVFLGDSITDYCNWDTLFNNTDMQNMGISGDTTDGVLNRIDEVAKLKPKKVFIMIGTNDLAGNIKYKDVLKNEKKIIQDIQQKSRGTKIYVESVLPINQNIIAQNKIKRNESNSDVLNLDKQLKSLSNSLNVKYIDLYSKFAKSNEMNSKYTVDGIHLNRQGYLVWKQAIQQYIVLQ